jgi:hypothetical protein
MLLEIEAILTETLGENAPSHANVKNWVAQFKRGDFSNFCCPGRAKELSTPRYGPISNSSILCHSVQLKYKFLHLL